MTRAIHQMVPNLAFGDAISQQVLTLRWMLRGMGYESEVYAQHLDGRLAGEARPIQQFREEQGQDAGVIYHFSIGSEVTDLYRSLPNPRLLVYHNITPAEFFHGVNERVAEHCRRGRSELATLRESARMVLADSEFNRLELEDLGFESTAVLPIVLDPRRYDVRPVRHLERSYRDGHVNLLHVGRIVPNKKLEDIAKIFYFYRRKIHPESRLFLVGIDTDTEIYSFGLRDLISELGVLGVDMTGGVSQRDLITYYQLAHAYLCMSEHEGFCVPVLEALHFGIPVIAYEQGAVAETLGDAGVIVTNKDHAAIAELLDAVLGDAALRGRLVERGRTRARDFLPEAVAPRFEAILRTAGLGR